jgi:pyruvate,water dikinase
MDIKYAVDGITIPCQHPPAPGRLLYLFSTGQTPASDAVGTKGLSLILMTRYGYPVPLGFVLSSEFFGPWLSSIQQTPAWIDLLHDTSKAELFDTFELVCQQLRFNEEQQQALNDGLAQLQICGEMPLLGVRISPLDKVDSFICQPVLGATIDGIEVAIRHIFVAYLEYFLRCKNQAEWIVDVPPVAIVVQQQIAAQTAGVAFSLNPFHDRDEVVIKAKVGLGTSLISGMVSADTYIVDKASRAVRRQKVGCKAEAIWLAPGGGTFEEPYPYHSQPCLSTPEILVLTELTMQVERHYVQPVDIEWAFVDGELYLLQAQPLTATRWLRLMGTI